MQLKKFIRSFTVIFNVHGFRHNIEKYEILEDLFLSFENSIIIKKNIKPEKLMEINQSGKSTIMVDSDTQAYDELRILVKLVSNFFIYTNQVQDFTLESVEKEIDDGTITTFGSEIYKDDLRELTFSPTIRSKWRNPQIINDLIQMS
jgi:hypothetical protein